MLAVAAHACRGAAKPVRRLAVLIASPWGDEPAMHNDLAAMQDALRRRGFGPSEIVSLEGNLKRDDVLRFLEAAHERVAGWKSGELFLYFSGHGFYDTEDARKARAGLQLTGDLNGSADSRVLWDEVFATLDAPARVRLLLLPDS
jgi:hypothetical protein